MNIKKGITTLAAVVVLTQVVSASTPTRLTGRHIKDPYPLHKVLQYQYQGEFSNPNHLLWKIVNELDIENNPRYFQTGVVYRNGKAYEIPKWEVEDFGLNPSHNNTYCNIFVIDVLNTIANTLQDDTYRIVTKPVVANDLRKKFETSPYWEEVTKRGAVEASKQGTVVVMSYVQQPHGHVAFVRPDSSEEQIWLWNVGSENSEKLKWNIKNNVKYFKKVR